jgi:hypothetical protein
MCLCEGGGSVYHIRRIEIDEAHTMCALVLGIYIRDYRSYKTKYDTTKRVQV